MPIGVFEIGKKLCKGNYAIGNLLMKQLKKSLFH